MAKLIKEEEIGNVSGGMLKSYNSILFESDGEREIFNEFMQTPEAKQLEEEAIKNGYAGIFPDMGEGTCGFLNPATINAFKSYCKNNNIDIYIKEI